MFVTIEGCEGVGKSTQLNAIKRYLKNTDQHAIFVREPGSTEISEQIRKIILDPKNIEMHAITEAMLYASCRAQLIQEVIKPALERGETIICDRFVDSSVAYQGYARGLGADFIKQINQFAIDGCMPDVTIFIDLHPAKSFRGFRMEDRLEQENAEFHDKVYKGFIEESKISSDRYVLIKPNINISVTSHSIITALREKGVFK